MLQALWVASSGSFRADVVVPESPAPGTEQEPTQGNAPPSAVLGLPGFRIPPAAVVTCPFSRDRRSCHSGAAAASSCRCRPSTSPGCGVPSPSAPRASRSRSSPDRAGNASLAVTRCSSLAVAWTPRTAAPVLPPLGSLQGPWGSFCLPPACLEERIPAVSPASLGPAGYFPVAPRVLFRPRIVTFFCLPGLNQGFEKSQRSEQGERARRGGQRSGGEWRKVYPPGLGQGRIPRGATCSGTS